MRFMMEACEFWKKIKQNLSQLGKTQEWLCSKTGMDLQSLRNRIHKNRFPTVQETLKILSVFEISAEDFFGMNLPKNEPFVSKNVMLIPVMDQVFSAGKGQYVPEDESVVEYVSVPNELKRYGKNLAATKVRGDSMEPTLYDGDTIICDNGGYDGTDGVYTILYKGCGFVKRLQRTGDGVRIISDNVRYDPMFASENSESENFSVIGKVRYVMHKI